MNEVSIPFLEISEYIPVTNEHLVAILIGACFGSVLYLSGFADARRIAGVFYLRDLSVPIVMFSAIVSSMVIFWMLMATGVLEISEVTFLPTYVWPMVVGGFILGIGMVVAGYCPGTAMVATMTGRIDGFVVVLSIMAGDLLFGNYFEYFSGLFVSSRLGVYRVHELLGVSFGGAIFLVIVLAISMMASLRALQRYFYRETYPAQGVFRRVDAIIIGAAVLVGAGCALIPDSWYLQEPEIDPYHIYQIPGWDRGPKP